LELLTLLRVLIYRWWLIALPVVVVTALTLPDLLRRAPASTGGYSVTIDYTAAQSMEAIPRADGDYQDIWIASEYAVNAFTDWVTGSTFNAEVTALAESRGATIPTGALGIAADNEKSVGRLTFGWNDADQLTIIADAVVEILQTRTDAYFAQLGGVPASVTILSRTPPTPAPPPLVDRFGSFVRIGLGVIVGIGLALLAHYLDPAVRRRDDVESAGVRVIAAIPK
jgi:capsular polysaccharide biosynthesis protein